MLQVSKSVSTKVSQGRAAAGYAAHRFSTVTSAATHKQVILSMPIRCVLVRATEVNGGVSGDLEVAWTEAIGSDYCENKLREL